MNRLYLARDCIVFWLIRAMYKDESYVIWAKKSTILPITIAIISMHNIRSYSMATILIYHKFDLFIYLLDFSLFSSSNQAILQFVVSSIKVWVIMLYFHFVWPLLAFISISYLFFVGRVLAIVQFIDYLWVFVVKDILSWRIEWLSISSRIIAHSAS